jgi:hypothetical protein
MEQSSGKLQGIVKEAILPVPMRAEWGMDWKEEMCVCVLLNCYRSKQDMG